MDGAQTHESGSDPVVTPTKVRRLLVIRSSAMGDVAMTSPVLAEVIRRYPHIEIVMLTRSFYEAFFDGIPNFSIHNIDLARYHRGAKGLIRLYRELRKAHKIDAIIDLNDKIYSKLLRKFYRFSGVASYHIDKGRDEKKALTRSIDKAKAPLRTSIERYADVFAEAGLQINPKFELRRNHRPIPSTIIADMTKVGMLKHSASDQNVKSGPWIGIAPFAQHKGKIYPLDKIKEVITGVTARYPECEIFIFGGGASEKAIAEAIAAEYARCRSTIGRFSLREEMDLIANLDLMVSMDSSAMHMASLVGVRVISVWGATHPYAGFLGFGQSVDDAIGLDTLECRPCSVYGHKECFRSDYACLNDLPPNRIYERIAQVLDSM